MKKLLLILFALMLLAMPMLVSAEFIGYGISRVGSNQSGQYCASTFRTNGNCSIFTDRVFFDYDSDKDFLTTLLTEGFTESIVNEVSGKNFLFYLRWQIVLPINTTPYDKFEVYCIQTQTENVTTPTLVFINETIPVASAGNYSDWIFSEVNMYNGQQLRCDFSTYYDNGSVLMLSNPIQWDLMLPSYKTFFAEAQQRENLRIQAENEELQAQITGEARNNAEYIASAVTNLVRMNFKIWVVLYWVLMIGLVIGVFALLIYILFWFYNYVKKSLK
jgi:hypothetical protein